VFTARYALSPYKNRHVSSLKRQILYNAIVSKYTFLSMRKSDVFATTSKSQVHFR
jgi:hypothetical protein